MADFTSILQQLDSWSLFELNRLNEAIHNVLNDPDKNLAIKNQLNIGMLVSYFSSDANQLIQATIIAIRKTRVTVINTDDKQLWDVAFYQLNLENINTRIQSTPHRGHFDRNSLNKGDLVGWHSKSGEELYGTVVKLNPKFVRIQLATGEFWRVSYSLLFPILDGEVQTVKSQLPFDKHSRN